jgi:hypothetical protein
LRVLALRSEPAVPMSGETATLSALVYTPPPDPLAPSGLDPTLTYAWSWCPFPGPSGQGYPCLKTIEDVQAAIKITAPASDLGHGPTASFPYTIDSAVLQGLCKATSGSGGMGGAGGVPGGIEQLPQLDCTGGVPIQIKLVVKTDGDPKGVTSVFTMRLGLEATDANANPAIAGLEVLQNGAAVAIDAANTSGVTLTRDIENPLQLPADLVNQSEKYLGTDDNDHPAMVDERLFVTWFVETGDTKDQATGLIVGTSDPQVLLHNTWTPAVVKTYPRTTARILLVLRDNRAGVGWYEGRVNLAEAPQ